jgi:hypothetical protein
MHEMKLAMLHLLHAHTEGLQFRGGNGEASSLLRLLALSCEQQSVNGHQAILIIFKSTFNAQVLMILNMQILTYAYKYL